MAHFATLNLTESISSAPSWLFPLVIGWLLSTLGILITGWLAERREKRTETRRLEAERCQFAAAIAAELGGLLTRYKQTAGDELEKATTWKQFQVTYLPRFNYFAVFDANLSKVGLLSSKDACDLVAIYIQAKGHMDSLITWGQTLERVYQHGSVVNSSTDAALGGYFGKLKSDHDDLIQKVPAIVQKLKSYSS